MFGYFKFWEDFGGDGPCMSGGYQGFPSEVAKTTKTGGKEVWKNAKAGAKDAWENREEIGEVVLDVGVVTAAPYGPTMALGNLKAGGSGELGGGSEALSGNPEVAPLQEKVKAQPGLGDICEIEKSEAMPHFSLKCNCPTPGETRKLYLNVAIIHALFRSKLKKGEGDEPLNLPCPGCGLEYEIPAEFFYSMDGVPETYKMEWKNQDILKRRSPNLNTDANIIKSHWKSLKKPNPE